MKIPIINEFCYPGRNNKNIEKRIEISAPLFKSIVAQIKGQLFTIPC